MSDEESQNRREFLKKFAYMSVAGSALLLTSCDSENSDPEITPKYGALQIFEPPDHYSGDNSDEGK